MLFSSTVYLLGLPLGFLVYWLILPGKARVQNAFLLLMSVFLYGMWDKHFLWLMLLSAMANYGIGIIIADDAKGKKTWLWTGILFNLVILGLFKYYDFFITGLQDLLQMTGIALSVTPLRWLIPLGLSYFTFQSMGYLVDVYRNKIDNPGSPDLFLLLLFFPKVIAGPIEPSAAFLNRLSRERQFDGASVVEGLRQILWGVFKKVVIADNIAIVLSIISQGSNLNSGSTTAMGMFLYAIQIYADFSAYSDIAIGSAALFGIQLSQNFNYPYFSRDIRDFWRRWHMSLMTWFRDYLFLPLSYSLSRRMKKDRYWGFSADKLIYGIATFVVFFLCGLWHGASQTFIVWGLLNALWFLPFILRKKKKKKIKNPRLAGLQTALSILGTFILVTFTWVFFSSDSITKAFYQMASLFTSSLFSVPTFAQYKLMLLIPLMFIVEWKQRKQLFALSFVGLQIPVFWRWMIYFLVLMMIYFLGAFNTRIEFLYFGF